MSQPRTPNASGASHGPLTPEQIVEAALQLLDQHGLDGLTMRTLAEHLGVKAASLYWHITGKEELLELLADRMCEEIRWPEEDLPWRVKVLRGMHDYRRVLLRYRDSAEIFVQTSPSTPNRYRLIEKLFQTFIDSGFTSQEALLACGLFNNYVIGFVSDEVRLATREVQTDAPNQSGRKLQSSVTSVPPMEEQFQFGLDTLLDGLEVRLADHSAGL